MMLWGNVFAGLTLIFIFLFSIKRFPLNFSMRHLVLVSLLVAIGVVLGTFAKISIPLYGPESFEIKFDTLPVMVAGILFGPTWGFVAGVMMDWIQLLLYPVGFPFFGFTLNLALTGFIAGILFHSKSDTKNLIQSSLKILGFVSIVVLATVVVSGSYSRKTVLPIPYRWGIGVTMVVFLILIGWMYLRLNTMELKDPKTSFMARFSYLVIICELLIQLALTSLWLYLMFQIPVMFLVIPRLLEAIPMILIFMVIGRYLYPWVQRFTRNQ